MNPRRVIVGATVAVAALTPAIASAKAPSVTTATLQRGTGGTLVLIADADYTGNAHTAQGLPDARSRAILTATLISGRHRVTVTDTTLFGEGADRGHRVHFDIRIPRATAKVLGAPKRVRARFTLGREASVGGKSPMAVEHGLFMPSLPMRLIPLRAVGPRPPAPPIGFEQVHPLPQGQVSALVCVTFMGPDYASPQMEGTTLALTANTIAFANASGSPTIGAYDTAVASDGSFSVGSYYDVFVNGFAQVNTDGPTISGTVPVAALSSPVSSSTPDATLVVQPPASAFPASWTLSPLMPSEVSGVC